MYFKGNILKKKLQITDDIARLNLSENNANKEHVETLKPQLQPCRLTVKRKKMLSKNNFICFFFLTKHNTVQQYTV